MKKTYDLLLEKIESIKKEIRVNSDMLQRAADFGDLKENAEYKTAKENQERLFNKLSRWDEYSRCEVVDGEKLKTDVIAFGTSVKIKNLSNGAEWYYNFVGPVEYELESMEDIVTYSSPLAKQLMGKKVGDEVEVQLPARVDNYKILEILAII